MMKYKVLNNIGGGLMFIVALVVYMLTLEPSVSLWDCGEFISASQKLQVVHPPGAPFFLLVGRLFTMFAGTPEKVAFMVNTMSAIMSALTVMFTFWITTHFARKMLVKNGEDTTGKNAVIIGSGLVAALALTFSDSFWFSAVEGEVYAMSSAFTALTFWAMLKWEESNSRFADKWIVLIAFLIGLAIGTHLLNLLVIPAIVYIYYFKKYSNITKMGMFLAFVTGLVILFFIQKIIIPGVPALMAYSDLFFVNSMGMGFGSGVMFAIILIIAVVSIAIVMSIKRNKRAWNLGFICVAYILLGYSSYAMVVVRSLDNPPIDMNNPEEPFNLLSYINREQYGDRPLAYGPYFNARPIAMDYGSTIYSKGKDKYLDLGKKPGYEYEAEYKTFFPRMGDMQKENGDQGYRIWSSNKLAEIDNQIRMKQQMLQQAKDQKEKQQLAQELEELQRIKPTMADNLAFLFRYQLGHMYFRYFMWNFAGRQTDQQKMAPADYLDGNWISGVTALDAARLGPQKNLPDYLKDNKGRNKFYFLPLILGILGLIFHFKRGKNDAIVTMVLFVFTGILIIIFLNQPPFEPRERDYSLVGSFQTFCIWIGLGVLFIADKLKKWMSSATAGVVATGVAVLAAPTLMAKDGWDDHDRSGRRLGIDFAINYLESCAPNAILFTNGDNDTYPLWYAQNVEQIRTDVRVINLSLLPTDWYSQVLLDKVYKSEPLPLSLTKDELAAGKNEYFEYQEQLDPSKYYPLSDVLKSLINKKGSLLPTRNFRIPVTEENKKQIVANGVVSPADASEIASDIRIRFPRGGIMKSDLVVLDLIATNAAKGWPRPIYFTTTSGSDGYAGLEPYLQREGLTFRLVPIRTNPQQGQPGRVADDLMYERIMTKFKFSNLKNKKNFYLDDKAMLVPSVLQEQCIYVANDYVNKYKKAEFDINNNDTAIANGAPGSEELKQKNEALKKDMAEDKKRALDLLKKCEEEIPERVLPLKSYLKRYMAEIYFEMGDKQSAERHLTGVFEQAKQNLNYFGQFIGRSQYESEYIQDAVRRGIDDLRAVSALAAEWKMPELAKKSDAELKDIRQQFGDDTQN